MYNTVHVLIYMSFDLNVFTTPAGRVEAGGMQYKLNIMHDEKTKKLDQLMLRLVLIHFSSRCFAIC